MLTREWSKATKSTATGGCVEARKRDGLVQIRDSKMGDDSPILEYTRSEWDAFKDGVAKGEFDL